VSDQVRVQVTGLECFGYHGVFPEEREHGQRFVVDLDWSLIDTDATVSDHLADTVDYEAITEAVAEILEGPPVNLLEHLAALIADRVMTAPLVHDVVVTIRKPEVKLSRPVTETAVTLRRSR
jgi:dihydroneopterin aldolase